MGKYITVEAEIDAAEAISDIDSSILKEELKVRGEEYDTDNVSEEVAISILMNLSDGNATSSYNDEQKLAKMIENLRDPNFYLN